MYKTKKTKSLSALHERLIKQKLRQTFSNNYFKKTSFRVAKKETGLASNHKCLRGKYIYAFNKGAVKGKGQNGHITVVSHWPWLTTERGQRFTSMTDQSINRRIRGERNSNSRLLQLKHKFTKGSIVRKWILSLCTHFQFFVNYASVCQLQLKSARSPGLIDCVNVFEQSVLANQHRPVLLATFTVHQTNVCVPLTT